MTMAKAVLSCYLDIILFLAPLSRVEAEEMSSKHQNEPCDGIKGQI